MVKVSLFWEQLMEFQLGSHTENVKMTFLFHLSTVSWPENGTQVIKDSECVSEAVKRVKQGVIIFVVIEGTEQRNVFFFLKKQIEDLCLWVVSVKCTNCKYYRWLTCEY